MHFYVNFVVFAVEIAALLSFELSSITDDAE